MAAVCRACRCCIVDSFSRRGLGEVTAAARSSPPQLTPTFAFPHLSPTTRGPPQSLQQRRRFAARAPKLKQIQPPTQAQLKSGLQQTNDTESSKQPKKRHNSRSAAPGTSLRRAAAEAQRPVNGFIKRSGRRRFVDPDADTKEVTAYCATELYDIEAAQDLLRREGHEPDPFNTGLYPQVVHVQSHDFSVKDPDSGEETPQGPGDVFVFPYGTVVTWNVPERLALDLVKRVLRPAAENSHPDMMEVEDLAYLEDSSRDTSMIIGDTIILGTKIPAEVGKPSDLAPELSQSSPDDPPRSHEVDSILAKIAFSSGLARSTKLAVLENALSLYFSSTRHIPTSLSMGSKLRSTRSFILRKTGELLSIRAQLNLYSELTDSLPDLFWDSPHELGLEGYYDYLSKALDVDVRIKLLNEKMDYAAEIATVLRETLSEKHSTQLEWLIIVLIMMEVGFELWGIWRKKEEDRDEESTENLLRRYLRKTLEERTRD
ncbi:hypothetical protein LTR66_009295 [Elasticomyces elasticus]|nr:hypothetical protein LTR66_009295 [Elasticomyces elasticus]